MGYDHGPGAIRPRTIAIRWIEARDPEPDGLDWVTARLGAGIGLMAGMLMGLSFVAGRASAAETAGPVVVADAASVLMVRTLTSAWTETYADGMLATQPAPRQQTWRAPYSHASATGMLRLPKGIGFPPAGVMLLGYCARAGP